MAPVVDASVLVAAVLDTGSDGDWARSVATAKHLIAPQLAPVEAGNVRSHLRIPVAGPRPGVTGGTIVTRRLGTAEIIAAPGRLGCRGLPYDTDQ